MYEQLEIGDPYLRVQGKPEGTIFDIRYPSIELVYNIERPTKTEVAQFVNGSLFEIRAVELNKLIIITSKVGTMPWCDAPYNPNFGDCRLDPVETKTQGYGLTLLLTDSPAGTLKHMRLIGLGNDFSRKFRKLVLENKELLMSESEYDRRLQEIFAKYTTDQIVEYSSSIRYRYRD